MKKVLISAAGTMASISYIKLLKSKGFYVIGINAVKSDLAIHFCDEFHVVPVVSDTEAYIKAIETLDFNVFVPWLDEEHILFATRNVSFKSRILTSDSDSILIATDKIKTYDFCVANGIDISQRVLTVPAFVRKRFSRGSKFAFVENDQVKLDSLDDDEYLKQRILSGQEYTVDILCDMQGDYIYAVPRKRLEAINVSTEGQIDMNTDIIDYCKNIVETLPFKGCINIQVFNTETGLYLVEINPRLAGTSILSIKAGFDLLTDSIRLFLGEEINRDYHAKDKLKMLRYYEEMYV